MVGNLTILIVLEDLWDLEDPDCLEDIHLLTSFPLSWGGWQPDRSRRRAQDGKDEDRKVGVSSNMLMNMITTATNKGIIFVVIITIVLLV